MMASTLPLGGRSPSWEMWYPEEVKFTGPKNALVFVEDQSMIGQTLKQGLQMFVVLLFVLACNQNVIDVGEDEIQIPTDRVHQSLKCLCSIFYPERHPQKFPQAEWCDHCCFGD